jgi:pyruvate decarboxylase
MWQAVVNNLDDAHEQIDTAISTALKESKPVYISVSCNLSGIPHSTFAKEPVPFSLAPKYGFSLAVRFWVMVPIINDVLMIGFTD